MTKKNSKAKKIAKELLSESGANAASAGVIKDLTRTVRARKRKHKKRGFGKFASILGGAAQTALDIAPAVLPLLMTKHGPTRTAMLASGHPAPPVDSVGLATPAALQPSVGLTDIRPLVTNGKVTGLSITGLDYLGDVAFNEDVAPGEVIVNVDLNPSSPDWQGTRLQRESGLYERYNYQRLSIMFEPSAPATLPGQFISFIDTDADDAFDFIGKAAVQAASAHVGAEMFQVWQMGMAEYVKDPETQDFYCDPEGSDQRIVSAGRYRLMASTAIAAGEYGAVFAAYEIRLTVPQLESDTGVGQIAQWTFANADKNSWFGTTLTDQSENIGSSLQGIQWGLGASGEVALWGLPEGTYFILAQLGLGTNAVSNTTVFATPFTGNGVVKLAAPSQFGIASNGFTLWTYDAYVLSDLYTFPQRVGSGPFDNSVDPYLSIVGGDADSTNGSILIIRVDPTFYTVARHRRSLQDYERDFESMRFELDDIRQALARVQLPVTDTSKGVSRTSSGPPALLSSQVRQIR